MKKTKIVFLFGSGISICAGMPSTRQITEKILDPYLKNGELNKDIIPDEDFNSPTLPVNQRHLNRKILFIRWLKSYIDIYFSRDHESIDRTNYEDIYFVIDQIKQSNSGNYENPAIKDFVDNVISIGFHLYKKNYNEKKGGSYDSRTFFNECHSLLEGMIVKQLSKEIRDLSYLKFIIDVLKDRSKYQIEIFTLNHDLVLEKLFEQQKITYSDGFEKKIKEHENLEVWNSELLFRQEYDGNIKFVKLHGSINWKRDSNPKNWNEANLYKLKDLNESYDREFECYPALLIGTFNKMLDYSGRLHFIDLFHKFYESLRNSNNIIIAGYGFQDKGINLQLMNRILNKRNNVRLIVIDPSAKDFKKKARGVIKSKWRDLVKKGIIIEKTAYVKDLEWNEIKNKYFPI